LQAHHAERLFSEETKKEKLMHQRKAELKVRVVRNRKLNLRSELEKGGGKVLDETSQKVRAKNQLPSAKKRKCTTGS
jgi:hypothetical protein